MVQYLAPLRYYVLSDTTNFDLLLLPNMLKSFLAESKIMEEVMQSIMQSIMHGLVSLLCCIRKLTACYTARDVKTSQHLDVSWPLMVSRGTHISRFVGNDVPYRNLFLFFLNPSYDIQYFLIQVRIIYSHSYARLIDSYSYVTQIGGVLTGSDSFKASGLLGSSGGLPRLINNFRFR
jgi:hypothetical protein